MHYHNFPVVLDRFAGAQHVARASRMCTRCSGVAGAAPFAANELLMIIVFECLHT